MGRSWQDTYGGGLLKSADVPLQGRTVRIEAIEEETLREGERPKLVVTLHDGGRWVLNSTVCASLEVILGTADPDAWVGGKVVIYRDPSVRGPSGQVVGGIRVRAAAKPATPARAAAGTRAAPRFQTEPAKLLTDEPFGDDPDADLE